MYKKFAYLRSFALGFALSISFIPAIWSANVLAANLSGADMIDYTSYPVTTLENVTPKVMLTMSRDHQYFFKAYNDFTDLDGDGQLDLTYNNNFQYYGYFDPDKCYSYDERNFAGGGQIEHFLPADFTTDYYCDGVSGEWSGNFMNWATMSRMDIIRKIIYGGRRYEDRDSHTLLERALLPTDAHAFAKYYNGDDIHKLTPFSGIRTDGNNCPSGDATCGNDVDDIDEGITICNTTFATSGESQTTNARPLARVVEGNYSLWGASEVFQCNYRGNISSSRRGNYGTNGNDPAQSGIEAEDDSPTESSVGLTSGGYGPDYELHILACEPGFISASDDNENCRQYPDGNYKPSGLIQEYGEDERIHFGLFTGSYEKNISGGVLRKNIGPLDDEINVDTDGTFKADPNSAVPAVGVIRALDIFKIWGYGYGQRTSSARYYSSASSDDCRFQLPGLEGKEGECASWGNPMSELYGETIRYLAGLTPNSAFAANDNSYVGGLKEDDWPPEGDPDDPAHFLNEDNFCAGLNVVMINSSLNSYDGDTSFFTDIGSPDPSDLTDIIGDEEGITGGNYLVGRVGAASDPGNDELCTSKVVTGLGDVAGACPEGPTLDGTYHLAGMAHYAHTEDIRPNLTGQQKVTTYAVQLATNVPKFALDVDAAVDADGDGDFTNDSDVTILPAYRLVQNDSGGTLVDFKIVQNHVEVDPSQPNLATSDLEDFLPAGSTGFFYGKAMVQWEDSEQGGDFDKDMWGVISYLLDTNTTPATVTISTNAVNRATANGQLFGFITSGTTQDGFHAFSGIYGGKYADSDILMPDCNDVYADTATSSTNDDGNCDVADDARSHTFTVGGSGGGLLPDALFLAAKYGGFEDSDGDGLPNIEGEYDTRDTSGNKVVGGDGIPDTYFFVTNPAALEDALRSVFDQVIERVASGTAAAGVASEQEGTGAVFQALYDPIKTDNLGNEAKWMGTLHAVFVDPNGFLREDTDDDDVLDGYDVDKVVEIFFDEDERRSRLRRFTSSEADEFVEQTSSVSELESLNPIWNARRQLSSLSDVTTQRTYTDTADNGRYIVTWLDTDLDGLVNDDGSEQFDFTVNSFTDSNFGWLDIWDGVTLDDDEADKLVNYIRGEEQSGYRSRVIDYDKDGTSEVVRLGDIVNSTPTVQGPPAEAFDILSLDASYGDFRTLYRNRRNVVYVGANDGMIHAFNGGFFDVTQSSFRTSLTSEIAHPLGSEIWAYIPKNLLGHLQWLKDEEYTHVYYSDLKPFIFDAKIFADDTTHPNGWGTVLAVGMRLGGGHDDNGITLDTAANGIGGGAAADDVLTKSAYILMDITDPEQPPKLIAEVSPPGQYFTTSFPAVALIGESSISSNLSPPNEWFLLLGSGPTDIGSVESTQNAKLFAYDLKDLVQGGDGIVDSGPFNGGEIDLGESDTFVGQITVSDQDLDMKAEAVYFGTVGTDDGVGGSLYRMTIDEEDSPSDWETPFKLLDVNKPFTARPSITIDEQFRTWVIAGTGRLFTNLDKDSTAVQSLYGFIDQYSINGNTLIDPAAPTPLDHTEFKDVTLARTFASGDVDLDDDDEFDTTFDSYRSTVSDAGGWVLDYESDAPDFILPAERTVSNQTLIGGIVLSSAFTPTTDLCGAEGTSRIIGRAFDRGLVPPLGVFGQNCDGGCPDAENMEAIGSTNLGSGLASSPSIHIGNQEVPGKVTVIVQQSTGAITGTDAQTMGGLNNGEVSWQEYRSE